MATNAVTATGITTKTQAELVDFMTTAYTTIYGADVNLASNAPDGQMMMIFIQVVLDVLDLIVQVFTSMDPDQAFGTVLDSRVAYNGIQRQVGTYSITNITLVTSASVSLIGLDTATPDSPAYTIKDQSGNNWQLITSQTLSGVYPLTSVVAFQAQNSGPIQSAVNTITTQVTVVLGVTSVNNPTGLTSLGIAEESDAALKIRRQRSTSLGSQGYLNALEAALDNIPGITYGRVYENNTGAVNSYGIPGHSIWAIVAGTPQPVVAVAWDAVTVYKIGDLASSGGITYVSIKNSNSGNLVSDTTYWSVYDPIAQAIYVKRNAGCGIYFEPIHGTSKNITQKDGSIFNVAYSYVQPENLYIQFDAHSINGNPIDVANIKAKLVSSFVPGIFETININALAAAVQRIDPNVLVTNAGFSTLLIGPYTPTLTPASPDLQSVLAVGRIAITVV